jgi:hypothetical protein
MAELVLDSTPVERSDATARSRVRRGMACFVRVLNEIRDWMRANQDRVARVYLIPHGRHLRMYVIGKSATPDFALTKSLAQLTIDLARAGYSLIGSEVPDGTPDELAAFFNPEKALVLAWR